ncbi:hypothetical protein EDC04DRAFT_2614990 [Pisolithus marmoratus]|nr:hypothetical protein EDC04DRAFT_2614990 [Pisolithus marmoratus]
MACSAGSVLNALTCTLFMVVAWQDGVSDLMACSAGSVLNALTCTLFMVVAWQDGVSDLMACSAGSVLNALTCTLFMVVAWQDLVSDLMACSAGSVLNALTCTLFMVVAWQDVLPIFEVNGDISVLPLPQDVNLLRQSLTVQSIAEHAIGRGFLLVAEYSYFLMQHGQNVWKQVLSLSVEEYKNSNTQTTISKAVKAVFHAYDGDMNGLCAAIVKVIMENCMWFPKDLFLRCSQQKNCFDGARRPIMFIEGQVIKLLTVDMLDNSEDRN